MSEAIAFDTHRFVKRLTESGFTERQAETLAEEHVALLNTNLATKSDAAEIKAGMEALRQATKADIAEVKADIESLRQTTKVEIESLRQTTKVEIEALRQSTKADIEVLRQETKADIARVEASVNALRQSTRADIETAKTSLLKWMFGAMIAQGGLVVALIKLL